MTEKPNFAQCCASRPEICDCVEKDHIRVAYSSGEAFKIKRNTLNLSQRDLASVWGMGQNGERTIRRWEQGDVPVNPIAAYCIGLMLHEQQRKETRWTTN